MFLEVLHLGISYSVHSDGAIFGGDTRERELLCYVLVTFLPLHRCVRVCVC